MFEKNLQILENIKYKMNILKKKNSKELIKMQQPISEKVELVRKFKIEPKRMELGESDRQKFVKIMNIIIRKINELKPRL